MLSTSAKDLKNFDTNSVPQLDVTWLGAPCFEKTYLMNSSTSMTVLINLTVRMNITCLVSWSTTTRISVWPSDGGNCSMKSIEMDSQGRGGIGSCLSSPLKGAKGGFGTVTG